ncbi:MAG: HPF/RaiA family ribosome-associated protein [Ilumatobacter sp.]
MAKVRLDQRLDDSNLIDTTISTSGRVSDDEQEHAADAVSAALSDIDESVLRCVLRLEHATDPHHVRLATARFSVDLGRARFHAHADAETLAAAIDLAAGRLHEQLRRHVDRIQDARRRGDSLTSLDDAEAARTRWPLIERATRELVERHPLGPPESTVDEARFDLDALGFDFHPFVETYSSVDAIVRRIDDTVTVQFSTDPVDARTLEAADGIEIDDRPVPELSVDQARELLALGELDHVFFREAISRRGAVVYRRYDGHDGLIALRA